MENAIVNSLCGTSIFIIVAVTLDRRGETRPAWIEMASSQNWSRLTSQIGDGSTPIKEVK